MSTNYRFEAWGFLPGFWPPALERHFLCDQSAVYYALILDHGPGRNVEDIHGELGWSRSRRFAIFEDRHTKDFRVIPADKVETAFEEVLKLVKARQKAEKARRPR